MRDDLARPNSSQGKHEIETDEAAHSQGKREGRLRLLKPQSSQGKLKEGLGDAMGRPEANYLVD